MTEQPPRDERLKRDIERTYARILAKRYPGTIWAPVDPNEPADGRPRRRLVPREDER